jgi:hypothetical protein
MLVMKAGFTRTDVSQCWRHPEGPGCDARAGFAAARPKTACFKHKKRFQPPKNMREQLLK